MSTAATATERRTLTIRLVTPEGVAYDGEAVMVVAPSVMGEVGILPRHAPLIAFLKIGETRITLPDESKLIFATTEGYVSVEENQMLVMVEQAEEVGAIDKERAEESLRQAEETLAAAAGDDEVVRNAAELRKRRAENRLRTLEKHR